MILRAETGLNKQKSPDTYIAQRPETTSGLTNKGNLKQGAVDIDDARFKEAIWRW